MHVSRTAARRLLQPVTRPSSSYTCIRCLSRRPSSTSARPLSPPPPPPLPPPPPSAAFAALKSRRLISISGPDAAKYLQGVVTANILRDPATGLYTAFLSAQGRVLHDVFIYPNRSHGPDSFLVEVDAAEAERLVRHIKRYKLRAKFDLRLLHESEATVWQAWDDANARAGLPLHDGAAAIATLRDPRSPTIGHRIITNGDDAGPPPPPLLELERTPETSYRIRRYLHGVAEGQAEILREHALPAECNMDLNGAVDFHKGCYVGQELTIRTRHRGVVRKRILPCALYAADPPAALSYQTPGDAGLAIAADAVPPEATIARAAKRGRNLGKWLGGVGNVGLALCRLEIMTDLSLPGEPASVSERVDDEFVVRLDAGESGDDGEGAAVKVKAFVPDWLRQGLQEQARGH